VRKDIHPKYNKVKVVFPGGETANIMSTYGKSDTIHAELHYSKHPAWSGGRAEANAFANNIAEFNTKFGGLLDGFGGKKPNDKNEEASSSNESGAN